MCGCWSSQPSRQQLRQRTYIVQVAPYLVEQVEIEGYLQPRYFILPLQYEEFLQNSERSIRSEMGDLTVFRNISELQAYRQEGRNNILIICCRNMGEAKHTLQLPNFHTFSQIAFAVNFHVPDIEEQKARLRLSLGFRFKRIISYTNQEMINFYTAAKEEKKMYFCHADIGIINRTFITLNYLLRVDINSSFRRFYAWLCSKNGEALADQLQRAPNQTRIGKLLVQNIFSQTSAIRDTVNLLSSTKNPGILGHFSWFYSTVFYFIQKEYKTFKENPDNINQLPQQFIVWLKLSKEEVDILKDSTGQNTMFSTFLLGYTKANSSVPSFARDPNCYKLYINVRKNIKDYLEKVDMGFYIDQNRIIFNLLNLYGVDSVDLSAREIHLTYSTIGFEYNLRQTEFRYSREATKGNLRMMRLYDYFCLNKCYVKNEIDLLFSLQMYETYKEAVVNDVARLSKRSSEDVRNSLAETVSSFKELGLSSKYMNEQLGDAELMTRNFDKAVKHYKQARPDKPLRGLVKRLYFYYQTKKNQEFRKTIEQYRNNSLIERRQCSKFVLLAIDNYLAIMALRSGEYSDAYRMIHKTTNDISKLLDELKQIQKQVQRQKESKQNKQKNYIPQLKEQLEDLQPELFHSQSYRSFPLYFLIQKTSATIARSHGEVAEADITLKECDEIRPIFDGIHMIWLQ